MKKISSRWSKICWKNLQYRLLLLCKIFVCGLLLQFFMQTFITFKLWRDGKFWTLFWMWKEFILLIFVIVLIRYVMINLKSRITTIKAKEHTNKISRALIVKNIKSKFVLQFILVFFATLIVFFLLAIYIQNVWIKPFILSVKYDLIWFFIFWIWVCLALLFFTEKDKELLDLYSKIIVRTLRLGLIWWFMIWLMPNVLKYVGFDPYAYEWTVGKMPPAAYYTKIYSYLAGSYVRNSFIFERPTSFGFWIVAFFPVFVLWYLRTKSRKNQILPVVAFGLLIFSTRSRAWIAVRAVEAVILFFILYRKSVKKYFVRLCLLFIIWLWWIAYLWRWIMVREHSNTGHLVLMKTWRHMAKEKLITGRWAGYAGPASHQICYTWDPINIDAMTQEEIDGISLENKRCETIRKTNIKNWISTFGFNPENQYLQILIEYGIVGTAFRLWICGLILRYTAKMVWIYRNKNKSTYQELLYYCLLWFGIWFIWLCAEWLVLHSLADRMIVYPFFLLYGITVWLWENIKDKEFIPSIKAKKKKKKK